MKYIFSLVIVFFAYHLDAQRVTVSDEISIRSERAYEILGKIKDRFLLYREQPSKIRINAFNMKMRKTWEKELEFDKKRVQIIGITTTEEDFSVIYTFQEKKETIIKVQTYNERAILKDSSTIASYDRTFGEPKYRMVISEDKSKVLLYYIKDRDTFRGLSYDVQKKEALWFHQFKFESNAFQNEYRKVLLTNRGAAYFVVSQNNRKSKIEEHQYLIYRYGGEAKAAIVKAPMEGKMTTDVDFLYDNRNNALVGGGLFSIKNSARAEGYFSFKMPENTMEGDFHFQAFTEVMTKDIDKDHVNKKGNSLKDIQISDVVLRRDGGMLLVFEFTKEYTRRMAGGRGIVSPDGGRYTIDYYLEDLLIVALHPNGQEHWQEILRKKQHSQDDGAIYSSYFIFKTPSALRLIFNDAINFENTVSEYLLNPIGNYERNSVLSTENQNLKLRFREAIQIAANEMIVPSEMKGGLKLVRVTF